MPYDYSITIGTCGRGSWNSGDGGESWMLQRKWFFPPESPIVRALAIHPTEPHTIYAGADRGIHCSRDNGRTWDMISEPDHLSNVWALAIDPTDPETIFAGTSPTRMYRSRDGGRQWERLLLPELATECEVGAPRVTSIALDPDDPRVIWVGIEVDGILRSLDGGDTWERMPSIGDEDTHTIIVADTSPKRVVVLTPRDLYISTDMGENWDAVGMNQFCTRDNHANYMRWIAPRPDNQEVLYLGTGNFNVGTRGNIFRSTDSGSTWEDVKLPEAANSTVFNIATNPMDPERVLACTVNGEVWASEDGGDSWRKIEQVFGEILCVAWQPNSEQLPGRYTPTGTHALLGGEIQRPD